jgi:hypothetical protein
MSSRVAFRDLNLALLILFITCLPLLGVFTCGSGTQFLGPQFVSLITRPLLWLNANPLWMGNGNLKSSEKLSSLLLSTSPAIQPVPIGPFHAHSQIESVLGLC